MTARARFPGAVTVSGAASPVGKPATPSAGIVFPAAPSAPRRGADLTAQGDMGDPHHLPFEAHLTAAALRLWQGGAGARAELATRLASAFGIEACAGVLGAINRLCDVLHDPASPQPPAVDPAAIALLVAATLDDGDTEETARMMALRCVPAHRMQSLVLAARALALVLRRAALTLPRSPSRGCPHHP